MQLTAVRRRVLQLTAVRRHVRVLQLTAVRHVHVLQLAAVRRRVRVLQLAAVHTKKKRQEFLPLGVVHIVNPQDRNTYPNNEGIFINPCKYTLKELFSYPNFIPYGNVG